MLPKLKPCLLLILLLSLSNTFAVQAQTDDTTRKSLNEVVVTAQKRTSTLEKIPLALTALTSCSVKDLRLWNNKDLTGIVPNLYAADAGDGRDAISIRGITTTSYDPAVATYIDGINQFGLDTYIPALLDVQRIEILRGPQGTLYGRNAMGGVINIITRQPGSQPEAAAEITEGSYGQQRYTLALRTPLIRNKLFIGLAGLYDGRNGFYTNLYDHSNYDRQHSFTGNYFLKYLPGKDWAIEWNVKNRENRNHGAFPLSTSPLLSFTLDQNAQTTMIDNTFQTFLSVRHKGRRFDLVTQTAYQENYRIYQQPIDGDFSPLDIVTIINNYGRQWNNVRAYTEDIHFSSPDNSNSRWQWIAGAYAFYQTEPNKQATRYGKDASQYGLSDSLFSTIDITREHKWGSAFYGQFTYSLNPRTHFTAGLRYDYEHQWEQVSELYQHDPSPHPVTILPDTAGHTAFYAFSPHLALDYQLHAHTTAYITYSRGFRTGGLTQLSSDATQPPLVGFHPEYSNNYEIGIKHSGWSNRLRANLALFYVHIDGAQEPTLILPDAITVTKNAGRLNNWGAEGEITLIPLKGLEINYNAGFTHSRFQTLRLAQNGEALNLAGRHQIFAPQYTSLLVVQYTKPVGRQLQAFIHGEWRQTGTTWFDLANTIKQTPYALFNIRTGFRTRLMELAFWGRNLANKKYISYAYDFGAWRLGDPFTWGITLGLKLGR